MMYTAEMFCHNNSLYNSNGALEYVSKEKAFNMGYIGSGIEFSADCGGDVMINFKLPAIGSYREFFSDKASIVRFHTLRFKLWVDGIQQEDLLINDKYVASHNLIIASGLKFGTHTFKIIRATEATVARKFYLCGVVLDGNLLNVSQKQRPYIEVYGDSISSGYGNISSREYTAFNKDDSNYVFVKDGYLVDPSTEGAVKTLNNSEYNFEDGTKTYAYIAAQNLGADISVFSKSGLGITVYGGKAEESTETMLKWYPNLPINKNADYVIINHITNDSKYYNMAAGLTKEGLSNAYVEFIKRVRADHKNARIIVIYGMMAVRSPEEDYYLTGEEVVLNAVDRVKKIDAEVYALKLPRGNQGGMGHPSNDEHIIASRCLEQFLLGHMDKTI